MLTLVHSPCDNELMLPRNNCMLSIYESIGDPLPENAMNGNTYWEGCI